MNLLTRRWSPIVIVFCIEPVGTLTAWTMKVMPNRAMITVTTADSKYSRQTDFGGPFGFVSGSGGPVVTVAIEDARKGKRLRFRFRFGSAGGSWSAGRIVRHL